MADVLEKKITELHGTISTWHEAHSKRLGKLQHQVDAIDLRDRSYLGLSPGGFVNLNWPTSMLSFGPPSRPTIFLAPAGAEPCAAGFAAR